MECKLNSGITWIFMSKIKAISLVLVGQSISKYRHSTYIVVYSILDGTNRLTMKLSFMTDRHYEKDCGFTAKYMGHYFVHIILS